MSPSDRRCPECQAPLAADGLDGLCPRCLAGLLFDVGPAPESVPDAPAPAVAPPPMTTRGVLLEVPGYEVTRELARGGMGIVYQATQLEPRREVALKMLLPHQLESAEFRDRFLLEARAIARLEHPHILPVYQVGENDGIPFFTMKLAAGGTLAERRARYRRSWREIAQLVATLAEAVQYAHERGVLHRDLKPGNVLFDDVGRPYVSDFGLAKLNDEEMPEEEPGQVVGTPRYVAPEVAGQGAVQATVTADIYGLGVILYELLAQKPPFNALSQVALLRLVEHAPPPPPSHEMRGVPYELDVVALRCLEKDPVRRFQTAGALAVELRRWLAGEPIESLPATRREHFWRWVREQRLVVGLITALAALGLVLVVGSVWVALRLAGSREAVVEERDRARNDLVQARLGEARGLRQSGSVRVRDRALGLLAAAARVEPRSELRDEAAAILARWEVGPEEARHRHTAQGMPLDLSPTFELVADASPGGEVRVWRRGTGQVAWSRALVPGRPPRTLEFSPAAGWLAAAWDDGVVAVIQSTTGREFWRGPARWAGFLGDEGGFAVLTAPGRLEFRDGAAGLLRAFQLPAEATAVARVCDAPGRPDFLVQLPSHVAVFDGIDGHRRHLLPFTRGEIRSVAWRDNLLVVGDTTGGIRTWNLRSGQLRDLPGHRAAVSRLVMSSDATLLWSASPDGSARLWHARSGQLVGATELWQPVRFNGEGSKLGYVDGVALGIAPMLPPVGVTIAPLRGTGDTAVRHVEFGPDGQWLVAVQGGGVSLLDTAGNVRARLALPGVVSAHLDAGGRQLVVVQRLAVRTYELAGEGHAVRLVPGKSIEARPGDWFGPAGHLDGSGMIAVARGSGRVGLLDAARLEWKDWATGQTNVTAVDVDPEHRWLAVESGAAGTRILRPAGEQAWIDTTGTGAPAFSPDGRHLLLAGGELHRALSAGEWRTRVALDTGGGITMPGVGAWSLYGRAFALGGPRSGVAVVSTETWLSIVRLQPILPVTALAFDPHGRYLAVGTDDDHVAIWSLPELREALRKAGPLEWRDNVFPPGGTPVPVVPPVAPDAPLPDPPQWLAILGRDPKVPASALDLGPVLNRPLETRDGFGAGPLECPAGMPAGLATIDGVAFDVRGIVQLAASGGWFPDPRWPARVAVPVPGVRARRLHLLATVVGGGELATGTAVLRVRCEWKGGATTETTLRLGEELGDALHRPERPRAADHARVAWSGLSEASEAARGEFRLYRATLGVPDGGAVLERCELVGALSSASVQVYGITAEP